MSALGQLKILYHLALSPIRGETHQQRLESFYRGQAEHYDATRQRMLHGRDELFAQLPRGELGSTSAVALREMPRHGGSGSKTSTGRSWST
jgi:hypothetical protein